MPEHSDESVWRLVETLYLALGQMPEEVRQSWTCTELSEACLAALDAHARGDV